MASFDLLITDRMCRGVATALLGVTCGQWVNLDTLN